MVVDLPGRAELAALPESLAIHVPPRHADANGHMNVRHHLALHDEAGWRYYAGLGFDETFIEADQHNFFDLEHHLRYYAEVMVGDALSVRVRLLDRGPKVVHAMSYLVNVTKGELASTLEVTTAYVDLRTRRTVALESPHGDALDARLARDKQLPWAARVCGAMGVNG